MKRGGNSITKKKKVKGENSPVVGEMGRKWGEKRPKCFGMCQKRQKLLGAGVSWGKEKKETANREKNEICQAEPWFPKRPKGAGWGKIKHRPNRSCRGETIQKRAGGDWAPFKPKDKWGWGACEGMKRKRKKKELPQPPIRWAPRKRAGRGEKE